MVESSPFHGEICGFDPRRHLQCHFGGNDAFQFNKPFRAQELIWAIRHRPEHLGVAQLVAFLLWEQDVAGSSPAT